MDRRRFSCIFKIVKARTWFLIFMSVPLICTADLQTFYHWKKIFIIIYCIWWLCHRDCYINLPLCNDIWLNLYVLWEKNKVIKASDMWELNLHWLLKLWNVILHELFYDYFNSNNFFFLIFSFWSGCIVKMNY